MHIIMSIRSHMQEYSMFTALQKDTVEFKWNHKPSLVEINQRRHKSFYLFN